MWGSRLCQSGAQDVPTPSSSYLPQPKSGGRFQVKDQSQDKAIPPRACCFWKHIWPRGLQITNILSTAMRATVQREAMPEEGSAEVKSEQPIRSLGKVYDAVNTSKNNNKKRVLHSPHKDTAKPSSTQPVLPREECPRALLTTDSSPPVMAVPRSATAMFTRA